METHANLDVVQDDAVLKIVLNRPKVNAFSLEMIDELIQVLERSMKEPTVRCLVLSGHGDYFSTGQDIEVILELGDQIPYRKHLEETYNHIVYLLRILEKPVLTAINGPVAGAALGLVLATDIRWASETASFTFGFTRVGLSADAGTAFSLPMNIGWAKAMEMAFTNQPMTAPEALSYGLVSKVFAPGELMDEITNLAHELTQGPTRAYGLVKRAFNHVMLEQLSKTMRFEAYLQEIAGSTQDHREGVKAFAEKRPPHFRGS
jgi:2-(1,2-epoxy-1,2-dihydrophenyl)acetyl-CoA isomerase